MRRAIVAVLGTAAGTTLLVGLKAGLVLQPAAASPSVADARDSTVGLGQRGSGAPGSQGPGSQAPGADGSGRSAGVASPAAPGASTPRGSGPATGASPGRSGTAAAGKLRAGTFTGTVVRNQYGVVQVRITVTAGRIADVVAVQTPDGDAKSVEVNKRAAPLLRQEALTAQSAEIQTVSGATYTSKGYRTSLQAALDAAKRA